MTKKLWVRTKDRMRQMARSGIVRNYLWVFLGQNAGSVFSMITLIFTLKLIDTETNAALVVIQTYCLLIANLLSLRTFNGLIKFTTDAWVDQNYERARKLLNTSLLFDVLAGLLSLLCGYFLIDPITTLMGWKLTLRNSLLAYLPVVFCYPLMNGAPVGILRKLDQFKQVNLIHAAVYAMQFVAVFMLWLSKTTDYRIVFAVYAVTEVVECMAVLVLAFKVLQKNAHYKKFWQSGITWDWEFTKYNLFYGIITSFDQLLGNVSTLLINKYIGNFATVYLKVITKICSVITKLTKPISQVFYPELCKWIAEKKYKKSLHIANRYFWVVNGAGMVLGLVLVVSYKSLLSLFGETMDGTKVQSILYMSYSILSVAIVCYNQLVFALNMMQESLILTVVFDIVYIVLLIPVIRTWGIFGYLGLQIVQLLSVFLAKYILISKRICKLERASWKDKVRV